MKNNQVIKAFIALGIALVIVFAIRALAFTIYTVPSDISGMLRRGDRVVVNRLSHASPRRGDYVVFRSGSEVIGRVDALPGDTISLSGRRYAIPMRCCNRCTSPDCQLYLVNLGYGQTLVYKHEMVGRARRLFHLPW